MSTDREEHIDMVDDCMRRQDKMSEWEQGFIQSIHEQLERGEHLTTRAGGQVETLEKIWEKVT